MLRSSTLAIKQGIRKCEDSKQDFVAVVRCASARRCARCVLGLAVCVACCVVRRVLVVRPNPRPRRSSPLDYGRLAGCLSHRFDLSDACPSQPPYEAGHRGACLGPRPTSSPHKGTAPSTHGLATSPAQLHTRSPAAALTAPALPRSESQHTPHDLASAPHARAPRTTVPPTTRRPSLSPSPSPSRRRDCAASLKHTAAAGLSRCPCAHDPRQHAADDERTRQHAHRDNSGKRRTSSGGDIGGRIRHTGRRRPIEQQHARSSSTAGS